MKTTIIAEDGMWLTDGKSYGKVISLAKDADVNDYHEITDAEYKEMQKAQEKEML